MQSLWMVVALQPIVVSANNQLIPNWFSRCCSVLKFLRKCHKKLKHLHFWMRWHLYLPWWLSRWVLVFLLAHLWGLHCKFFSFYISISLFEKKGGFVAWLMGVRQEEAILLVRGTVNIFDQLQPSFYWLVGLAPEQFGCDCHRLCKQFGCFFIAFLNSNSSLIDWWNNSRNI